MLVLLLYHKARKSSLFSDASSAREIISHAKFTKQEIHANDLVGHGGTEGWFGLVHAAACSRALLLPNSR